MKQRSDTAQIERAEQQIDLQKVLMAEVQLLHAKMDGTLTGIEPRLLPGHPSI